MSREQDYFEQVILNLIKERPKNDIKFAKALAESLTDTLNDLEKAAYRRGRRSELSRLSRQISQINNFKWHFVFKEMGEKDLDKVFELIKYDVIEQLSAEEDE